MVWQIRCRIAAWVAVLLLSGVGAESRCTSVKQKLGQALCDGGPFHIGQGFQRSRGCLQRAREHVGESSRRHDTRFVESELAGDAAVKRVGGHRQHDRAHVPLEHDTPVAAPRQQQQMADRNDLMARALPSTTPSSVGNSTIGKSSFGCDSGETPCDPAAILVSATPTVLRRDAVACPS